MRLAKVGRPGQLRANARRQKPAQNIEGARLNGFLPNRLFLPLFQGKALFQMRNHRL